MRVRAGHANNRRMANPKIPPEIAKKIAAMKPDKPAPVLRTPQAKPGAPAAPPAAPAKKSSGGMAGGLAGLMPKVAAAGWGAAVLAGLAAFFFYKHADQMRTDALAEQSVAYEAKLKVAADEVAKAQADAAAAIKRAQDEATGKLASMQADLDFAKMPEIPLETVPRANQVIYVNNNSDQLFECRIRVFRELGRVTKEWDYSIKGHTFQDLGAIGDWVFAKGDKVDFVKQGFKPRSIVMQ